MRAPTRDEIAPYVEKGLVRAERHPDFPLTIYNYAKRVQFDRLWDDITVQTRGLILADDDEVVARPFKRIFNIGELESLPDEPYRVYDKLDGSLFIVAEWDGAVVTATRGSFTSDQSKSGRRMFMSRDWWPSFDFGCTFLFEVIYPENRIVVDYGSRQELIHLATIDNETGRTVSLSYPPFRSVEEVELDSLDDIPERPNAEGYVIHFQGESDLRVKAKHPNYIRLHRLYSGINERVVWEYLSEGKDLDELIDVVPDEFHQWVRDTEQSLRNQFTDLSVQSFNEFFDRPYSNDRKELARYFSTCTYPHVNWLLFDGHDDKARKAIWDLAKPKGAKPYMDQAA